MIRRIALSVLLLLGSAAAQFTTVSGTVTDPNGVPYAYGTIAATLISSGSPTLNGLAYTPPTQPVGLNSAGSFLMQLADNTVLLPGGSQWKFLVCSGIGTIQPAGGTGPVCFTAGPLTISGASQSITSSLVAVALALSAGGGINGGSLGLDNGITVPNGLTYTRSGGFNLIPSPAANGQLTLFGLTSGSCPLSVQSTGGVLNLCGSNASITPAGALTVVSCIGCPTVNFPLNAPNANVDYGFTANANFGIGYNNPAKGGILYLNSNGTNPLYGISGTNGFEINNGWPICWDNGTVSLGTPDVGLSRTSPTVLALGQCGAAGDETGLAIRSASICRITADVSLTVNTANPFCQWSLPAVAKSWAWRCDIIWSLTAGTGTNNFSLGVNASQTPTAATNAAASIWTTQTGTMTQGVVALSASGAVNVLTSPTYTPAATLEQAKANGDVLASGTAGTFAITATAAGTTATAAIKAGSTCEIQ